MASLMQDSGVQILIDVSRDEDTAVMKRILITALLVLLACTSVYAVPASPDPVDALQPDGSSIRMRIKGDE